MRRPLMGGKERREGGERGMDAGWIRESRRKEGRCVDLRVRGLIFGVAQCLEVGGRMWLAFRVGCVSKARKLAEASLI